MALHTTQFAFSANTEGQGWGDMSSRCAILFHLWAGLATWCDPNQETGLKIPGLIDFAYRLNSSHAYTANTEIGNYAAFESPGIGESTELNHEEGWLNRCQYVPTKASIKKWNDMLKESGEDGFISGLTIQTLSTEHSGVTSLGLKISGEDQYSDNQAVKWWDLYFEMEYDDEPIPVPDELIELRIINVSCGDIPAYGGAVVNHSGDYSGQLEKQYISYTVQGRYSSNPSEWVDVTSLVRNNTSNVSVTANTLGTTPKERTKVGDFTLTVNYGGKGATATTVDVYQQENKVESEDPHEYKDIFQYSDEPVNHTEYSLTLSKTADTVSYDSTEYLLEVRAEEHGYTTTVNHYADCGYTVTEYTSREIEFTYLNGSSESDPWYHWTFDTTTSNEYYLDGTSGITRGESLGWVTAVTITTGAGNNSTIRYEENDTTNSRSGDIAYGYKGVISSFTLTQQAQGLAMTGIDIVILDNDYPVDNVPAYGGSIDCDDVSYRVDVHYNDSTYDESYTHIKNGVDNIPDYIDIECSGPVNGENLYYDVTPEQVIGNISISAICDNLWDSDDVDIKQDANELEDSGTTIESEYSSENSSARTNSTTYHLDCTPATKSNLSVDGGTWDETVSGYSQSNVTTTFWSCYTVTTNGWSSYTSNETDIVKISVDYNVPDFTVTREAESNPKNKVDASKISYSATNNDNSWLSIGSVGNNDISRVDYGKNQSTSNRNSTITYWINEHLEANDTVEVSQMAADSKYVMFVSSTSPYPQEAGTTIDGYAGQISVAVSSNTTWSLSLPVGITEDSSKTGGNAGRTNLTLNVSDNIDINDNDEVYVLSATTTDGTADDNYTITQDAVVPEFEISGGTHFASSAAGSTTIWITTTPSGLTYDLDAYDLNTGGVTEGTGDTAFTVSWSENSAGSSERTLWISGETTNYDANLEDEWEIIQDEGAALPTKSVYVRMPFMVGAVSGYVSGDQIWLDESSCDILDGFGVVLVVNGDTYSCLNNPDNEYFLGNDRSYWQLNGLVYDINDVEDADFKFKWYRETNATAAAMSGASLSILNDNDVFVYFGQIGNRTSSSNPSDSVIVGTVSDYATVIENGDSIYIDFNYALLGEDAEYRIKEYAVGRKLLGLNLTLDTPSSNYRVQPTGGTISSTGYTARAGYKDTVVEVWRQKDNNGIYHNVSGSPIETGQTYWESITNDVTPAWTPAVFVDLEDDVVGDAAVYDDLYGEINYQGLSDSDSVRFYQAANEKTITNTTYVNLPDGGPFSSGTQTISGPTSANWYCSVNPNSDTVGSGSGTYSYTTSAGHEETTVTREISWTNYYQYQRREYEFTTGYIDGNNNIEYIKVGNYPIVVEDPGEENEEIVDRTDNVTIGNSDYTSGFFTEKPSTSTASYGANPNTSTRTGTITFRNASHTAATDSLTLTQAAKALSVSSVQLSISPSQYVIPNYGGSFSVNDITIEQVLVTYSDGTTSQNQNLVDITYGSDTEFTRPGLSAVTSERTLGSITVIATSNEDSSKYDSKYVTVKQAACAVQTTGTESWDGAPTGSATRNTGVTDEHTISLSEDSHDISSAGGQYNVTIYAYTTQTTTGQSATTYTKYSYPYTAYTSGHISCGNTTSTAATGSWETYRIEGSPVRKKGIVGSSDNFITASTTNNGNTLSVTCADQPFKGAQRTGDTVVYHENNVGGVGATHETIQKAHARYGLDYVFRYFITPIGTTTLSSYDGQQQFNVQLQITLYGNQQVYNQDVTNAASTTWRVEGPASGYVVSFNNGLLVANNTTNGNVTGTVVCDIPESAYPDYDNRNGDDAVAGRVINIVIPGKPVTPTSGTLTINAMEGNYGYVITNTNTTPSYIDHFDDVFMDTEITFDTSNPLQYSPRTGGATYDCQVNSNYYVWQFDYDLDEWVTSAMFTYNYTNIRVGF